MDLTYIYIKKAYLKQQLTKAFNSVLYIYNTLTTGGNEINNT